MLYYAGIGSRETPAEYIELFKEIGKYLAIKGLILRSGAAEGADEAFEKGCNSVNGKKEIYLPWYRFSNSTSKLIVKDDKAFEIAAKYHPNWNRLSNGAKKLQARNTHQVLGMDFKTESEFIICWTKNGKGSGGTGQAIRIANDFDIPVFDCGKYKDINICREELYEFFDIAI